MTRALLVVALCGTVLTHEGWATEVSNTVSSTVALGGLLDRDDSKRWAAREHFAMLLRKQEHRGQVVDQMRDLLQTEFARREDAFRRSLAADSRDELQEIYQLLHDPDAPLFLLLDFIRVQGVSELSPMLLEHIGVATDTFCDDRAPDAGYPVCLTLKSLHVSPQDVADRLEVVGSATDRALLLEVLVHALGEENAAELLRERQLQVPAQPEGLAASNLSWAVSTLASRQGEQ